MAGRVVAARSSSRRQGSTRSSQYSSRNASRSSSQGLLSLSDRSSLYYRFNNRSDPYVPVVVQELPPISPAENANESLPLALPVAQAEVGEVIWKSTRNVFYRLNHQKRFFWIHPRSKTIHWKPADSAGSQPSSRWSKGASIVGVEVVKRPNNKRLAAAHDFSILIKTPKKSVQITADNQERHEIWLTALQQLIHGDTLSTA